MSNHAEEQAIIETILDYVNEDRLSANLKS